MLVNQPIPRVVNVSRHHLRLTAAASIARNGICRRTYAAATATKTSPSSTPFQVSDVNGIKVASRDDGGPTTGLSVVLRAGSRYAPVPGLAHLLDKFAWKVPSIDGCTDEEH
jgi:ubiquinol-cytochrome c reductase core subunit 2